MGTLGNMEELGENLGAEFTERIEDLGERLDIEDRSAKEGNVTRKLEHFTASLPSTTWLILAGGSMIGSIVLRLLDKKHAAIFVGDWVPTFLLLGIYNKLVQIAGSDRQVAY